MLSRVNVYFILIFCKNQVKFTYKYVHFCKQIFNNLIEYDRALIKPYELDIVIPDLNLAIEFNGVYYHSIEARNITWLSFNEN